MKKLRYHLIFVFVILFSCIIVAQNNPLPMGTYTIGSGGYFPTIDSAFNKLSNDGISGAVTLELIDTYYQAPNNSYFSLDGPISGAGPNSGITIKPAANKNITIEGNGFGLQFSNISYLTLDGVGLTGVSTLIVHALSDSQVGLNAGVNIIHNSDHNVIQNITAITEDYVTLRSSGIAILEFDATSNDGPDSNLVQNNFIKKAGTAILLSTGPSKTLAQGNIIKGNFIGSETDSLIMWGIQVTKTKNTIIEGNIIQNIKVVGDIIQNLNFDINNTPTPGIVLNWSDNGIIRNNIVHNITTLGGECGGIVLANDQPQYSNNNLVYNNMIYDIQCISTQDYSPTIGIGVFGQDNTQIYYNSVYLNGTRNGLHFAGSATLWIDNPSTNIVAKNNILVNNRDESPSIASSIYDYSIYNLTSDNNDLFVLENQYNWLVQLSGSKYKTLARWQAKGKDLNSVNEMPNFKTPDLHIDESIPTNLEKRAAPVADVNTDFDGDLRDVNLPDIGADEFNGQVTSGPLISGYSVGTKGYFPTIDSAFNRLSNDGISGAVTLELIDTFYQAPNNSYFSLAGPISGTGPNGGITIKPAASKNVTIEGNGFGLQFSNMSYLTLDGVGLTGATTLTVHALSDTLVGFNAGVNILHNSDHNVIQNITAITEDYVTQNSSGILIREPDASNDVPDSNLIQNNFIKKAETGILVSAGPSNAFLQGNIIEGNLIGSETDSLILWGIQVVKTKNTIIEGNIIQNIKAVGDIIQKLRFDISNTPTAGINLYYSFDGIVRNNIVHNMKSLGFSCVGIAITNEETQRSNNDLVYNNMIYDIQCVSTQDYSTTNGISVFGQDNTQIYYNSVYLSGTGDGANRTGSAALWIDNPSTNVVVKNNILVNDRNESPYTASSIYDYSISNLTSDNNDLFYLQNQHNCLIKIGGSKYNTLADWQAKSKDLISVTEMPNFKFPDLHIDENIPTKLESHGTPIAGIDEDFDGEARRNDSTDIGADEFNGIVLVAVKDNFIRPIEFALEQNYPNPFNPTTKIKYSIPKQSYVTLKVYDILGQEIKSLVNQEKPAGNYQIEFNSADLPSGVYFYRIQAGSFNQVRKMLLIK